MITEASYWMGRDSLYRGEWTDAIQKNGFETVFRVNKLLGFAEEDGIVVDKVNSGWRPKSVNEATSNSGKTSRHITAEACDLPDDDNRTLQRWCLANKDKLALCELWIESPSWCAKWNGEKYVYWLHLQKEPPASGKRVYIPSNKPPVVPLLDGERGLPVMFK